MKYGKAAGAGLLLVLTACAGGGGSGIMSDSGSGVMSADEIKTSIAGKTFMFAGGGSKGTVIFAEDGSTLFSEEGKGDGQGKWQARDGLLCQSISPGPAAPGGRPETCGKFARSTTGFVAGPVTLTPL
jgi:hypothetical protein